MFDKRDPTFITYAVPVNNQDRRPNETSIYRHPFAVGKDLGSFNTYDTLHDAYRNRFKDNGRKIGFGRREFNPDGSPTDHVEWLENGLVLAQAEALGSGIMALELVPENSEGGIGPIRFAGIYSKNTLEYIQFDVACGLYGITAVPIYDTLGEEATGFAFDQTKMEFCAVTSNHLAAILKGKKEHGRFKHLKSLMVLDPHRIPEAFRGVKEQEGITIWTIDEIKAKGFESPRPWAEVTPDTVYAFSYTSGTTGTPKATILTHRNMLSAFRQAEFLLGEVFEDDLYLSYLPMAHVMERLIFNFVLSQKGILAIYSGDVLKLRDDLRVFKPTFFVSVPRLFNRIYDGIVQGVKSKPWVAQTLFTNGIRVKKENLAKNCLYEHSLYDKLVFKKAQEALGGRVRMMLTGSAPISVEVLNFLKVVFCCPILEGYGQTEGTALEFITHPLDPVGGHVGGPSVQNEFKLVDIEEMNYTSQDKDEKGQARPRGEIWVRGPNVSPGYYMAPDKDKESFTPDGWLMTGDVGELSGPGCRLRIIDRKKNIFKLSQGEYIAPEKLEDAYRIADPNVTGVYIYGDSLKNCILAVVTVEEKGLIKLGFEAKVLGKSVDELAECREVKRVLLAAFEAKAKEMKFNSLEKVKDVLIEQRSFQELGLLTEAFKLKRNEAKKLFGPRLDHIYEKLDKV